MTHRVPVPREIRRVDRHSLRIVWADEHVSEYPNRMLRDHCPCAVCRERGLKTLPVVGGQGEEIYPAQIGVVGRYALSVEWSDGHASGIYSYATLRALCPCERCQAGERAGTA
jgi:DUF971 family protein